MKTYPTTIHRRFWALFLDYIFLVIASTIIILIFRHELFENLPKWLQVLLVLVFALSIMFYLPIAEACFHGQTLGKRALGIRVVRTDGSPASGLHCLQRYLLLSVDVVFTLGLGGLVTAMITERRQRIGDLLADTVVVTDNSHRERVQDFMDIGVRTRSAEEKALTQRINPHLRVTRDLDPLTLGKMHRAAECDLAMLRTHKADPKIIEFMERFLSSIHIGMFRHGTYTLTDTLKFALRSIPRAVYEARWAIFASLAVSVISYLIGVYSQAVDPDFFNKLYGEGYSEMTIENINSGDPMGVYKRTDSFEMFYGIFMNNFLVSLNLYVTGVFMLIGPVMFLLNNFVSFAVFDVFFFQHGYGMDAMVSPNEHGVLELSSLIMVGGAAILLGCGWLFPGRLTRLQAMARSARHSLLILVSTIPMLFVAAIIESFITRHTEWPMTAKLSIIIVSFIIILGYYVMLPILAKRG